MNVNKRKDLTASSLAVMTTVDSTAMALTDEPEVMLGEMHTETMVCLQNNHMRYDELTELIKNYYVPIRSAYSMIDTMEEDQGSTAMAIHVVVDSYMSQANQSVGVLGSGNPAIMQVVEGVRILRSGANSMSRATERSKSGRSVDRQMNMIVPGAGALMNQYEYYLVQRTVVAKALEIARATQAIQQTIQAQGFAVDADVFSAAVQLSLAKSQMGSVDVGVDQIYRTPCYYIGWDKGMGTVAGPVPTVDPLAVGTLDLASGRETTMNNNYSLISMWSGSGAGMSDFQARTTKGIAQKVSKIYTVDYLEDQFRSDMQTLYDTILEKKAVYDSVSTAYQSIQFTWNVAQTQRRNGTLGQIRFMQQELAYLRAQSGFKCADLNLQQALRNYRWAVRGASVSTG